MKKKNLLEIASDKIEEAFSSFAENPEDMMNLSSLVTILNLLNDSNLGMNFSKEQIEVFVQKMEIFTPFFHGFKAGNYDEAFSFEKVLRGLAERMKKEYL